MCIARRLQSITFGVDSGRKAVTMGALFLGNNLGISL